MITKKVADWGDETRKVRFETANEQLAKSLFGLAFQEAENARDKERIKQHDEDDELDMLFDDLDIYDTYL